MPTPRPITAMLAAAGHTGIAAVSYLVARHVLHELPGWTLGWARIAISGLCYLGLLRAQGLSPLPPPGQRTAIAGLSVIGILCNQGLFLVGLSYTTVAHAAILYALTPAVVLLIAALRGAERVGWVQGASVALAVLGAVLVLTEGGAAGPVRGGDLIILVGVLAWSLYTLLSRDHAIRHGATAATGWTFVIGAALALPLAPLAVPDWSLFARLSGLGWAGLAWMSLGSSLAGYLLWSVALRGLSATRVAVFTNLQPVLASLLGWAVLGEPMTAREAAGGAIVLLGVVGLQVGRARA